MYDIAVIGGGASGLAAALAAAETGRAAGRALKVVVLEKNPRVGKKLLTTGNGRCNLTNTHASVERYFGDAQAAAGIFDRYTPETVMTMFREHGLLCRELDEGRVYPYSLQASSVLNILRRSLDLAGVETVCDFPVSGVESIPGGFAAASGKNAVKARKVVVAVGGKACPQSGSEGDGYALLRPFCHTATELRPALTQVRTDAKRMRPLKGVRCMAEVTLTQDGEVLRKSSGEVQFTENSLSGICVFELSRFAAGVKTQELSLDLAPGYGEDELAALLRAQAKACGDLPASQLTEGVLNKALGTEVVKTALDGACAPAGTLTEDDLCRIAETMKRFRFPAQGALSWQNAQVTAGGVPLAEVDGSLQSRLCKGLYLCGELLNIDGGCGGFNLHWAWASGVTAGMAASSALLHL